MIEAALLTILESDTTLTAIVGERIYLSVIPQYSDDDSTTNSPCLVIVRTGTNYDDTECVGEEPTVDLNIIILADSFTQLAAIKNAIENKLRDNYSGIGTTTVTAGGVDYVIDDLELTDFRTEWSAQIEGNSKGLFRGLLVVVVRYET
jgi:hypothetical protein